ncbi:MULTISPECIES: transporter [Micrococcaceae]|jgi:ABC-2 type transport system permease protein|uniref:transporter n=1 Tax=Micrococcaceae TaxID=1268 RepID=UPI002147B6BF|nr:transporter [Paenarthrobacter sp. UW852]MCR1161209.1 transporter [Paenarthrobacter sp. UW852]
MVAHLLNLKWRLLLNGFKRSPWQLVGMALGLLYALGVLSLLVGGLVALRWADAGIAHTVVVLGGAVTVLGWAIIPLVASAADMTLDPARFTTFAIPPRQLLTGLALAGFIGIPGLATLIAALGTVGTWWRSVPAVSGALLGAVLGAVTCVVLSKVVTTATAGLASSRRFKDVSSIIVFIPLVLLGPIMAGVVDGVRGSAEYLPALARTVSWTPFGAPWSLGGDLAAGDVVAAAVKLLISVATIVVLLFSWHLLLQRALVTPPYSGGSAKKGGKLGLFGLLPGTPAGAVAARALIYWFKDPRYAASLVIVPMFPVLFFFAGSQSGSYGLLMILGPLTAFTMAWSICADVSYDNTAFALHLAAGVRGLDDRLGRALACLAISLPVVLLFTVAPLFVTGDWHWLPNLLGLSLGTLFTGLGLASVISARYNIAVPLPGDSPFKKPPGNVAQTLAVQAVGMGLLALLLVPELALVAVQAFSGGPEAGWINLAVGPLLGLVLFVLGVRLGGKWLDARGPEMFAQLSVNR